jgi:uncharacterized protein DUF1937
LDFTGERFWYFSTQYSRHPEGKELAYVMACKEGAALAKAGIPVFSPIAHSHGIAKHGGIDPVDHEFWMAFDHPMMANAVGLIVLCSPSWETSLGIAHEVQYFEKQHRPIIYMHPGKATQAANLAKEALND